MCVRVCVCEENGSGDSMGGRRMGDFELKNRQELLLLLLLLLSSTCRIWKSQSDGTRLSDARL